MTPNQERDFTLHSGNARRANGTARETPHLFTHRRRRLFAAGDVRSLRTAVLPVLWSNLAMSNRFETAHRDRLSSDPVQEGMIHVGNNSGCVCNTVWFHTGSR